VNTTELVLVDLSSIAYPIYLTTQSDPNPNKASQEIVARVRALASDHPHAAICCDSGRSFRHDLAAEYKANRPEREAPLHHQIKLACRAAAGGRLPGVVGARLRGRRSHRHGDAAGARHRRRVGADRHRRQGSAAARRAARAREVGPGRSHPRRGGVEEKFGVKPAQLRDYLTLVGDASDNIKGAAGIGTEEGRQLLSTFESLDACYEALAKAKR
jgi:DNA polymerase-1